MKPDPKILMIHTVGDRIHAVVEHGRERDDLCFRPRFTLRFDRTLGADSASVTGYGPGFARILKHKVDTYIKRLDLMTIHLRLAYLLAESLRVSDWRGEDFDRALRHAADTGYHAELHAALRDLQNDTVFRALRLAAQAIAPRTWLRYVNASRDEWLEQYPHLVSLDLEMESI